MDIPREQFDELLGGKEELPGSVNFMKYVSARSQEIAALTEAIEEPINKHRIFQKMPRHLRRRAMSHNPKRMPRRLRNAHLKEMEKSGLPCKAKRPSRKYRRRPRNLLLEYNRRQCENVWLETHIWHAKRFHIAQLWGYKLPNYPNDKSFRACYRATAKHCLIQDVSYLNCIELKGEESEILKQMSLLTSPECGLTFAAKATLSGKREGNVVVFKRGKYPFNIIGRVSFMWRPDPGDSNQTIWIWCHPAFYEELLQELIEVFELKPEENSDMDVDPSQEKPNQTRKISEKNVEQTKLETKNLGRLPKFSNSKIVMTILKDTLNRFRLTGPLAQVVLTEALKFVDINKIMKNEDKAMELENEEEPRSAWLQDFYKEEILLDVLSKQKDFWKNVLPTINSADELPMRMILSAIVMDPRLSMPTTRIKAVNDQVGVTQTLLPEGLSCHNPLWDTNIRDTVSQSKMAAAQLNSLRSRALVPGLDSIEWLGVNNISHLPIMLVQNPGTGGYGSGWDMILPAGWGMPMWLGLIYRGARAGGLRETERLTLEKAYGPTLPPDSKAGRESSELKKNQQYQKHFKLPPNKRPNYVNLGVVAPFHCPWDNLLQDWYPSEGSRDYYVIRNRAKLDFLKCLLSKQKAQYTCEFSELDKSCGLVQVGVEISGKGTLGRCSLICTAGKKDLKLLKDKTGRGPLEPLHKDDNEENRKTLRENHITKLKRLRKKRVKEKRQLEEEGDFTQKPKSKVSPTEEIVKEQANMMRELWLPSDINTVKNSSSRNVIGFVTCGDYSFTKSQSFGYGFVALSAILSVIEKNQVHFLVRNVTSLQYYFARLKVLDPV